MADDPRVLADGPPERKASVIDFCCWPTLYENGVLVILTADNLRSGALRKSSALHR
jgi:hypothetical protein